MQEKKGKAGSKRKRTDNPDNSKGIGGMCLNQGTT